jgi:hypothetical protein
MFRRIRHLPQLTRLGAFVATGMLVTAVVSVRSARAQVNEGMRHLARQLMPYAEQGVMEAPRRVVLNGESLYLSMGTTRDGVEAVLDYYEARCARTSGHLSDSLRALDHAAFNQLWAPGARRAASIETVRIGDASGGYVACLDVGETRLTPQEILRRAESMIASGDLSRYGELRYAYVTRGSTGNTRILTVATQGQFNILRLFPDQGDAPGADIPGLARYPSMRRVISAYEDGVPNKLGVYTVRAPGRAGALLVPRPDGAPRLDRPGPPSRPPAPLGDRGPTRPHGGLREGPRDALPRLRPRRRRDLDDVARRSLILRPPRRTANCRRPIDPVVSGERFGVGCAPRVRRLRPMFLQTPQMPIRRLG